MYIQFRLPTGAGGMAAQHMAAMLDRALKAWSKEHDVKYNKKLVKYTVRVTFDDDRNYTLFALTWRPVGEYKNWLDYEFIEPMNIDRNR